MGKQAFMESVGQQALLLLRRLTLYGLLTAIPVAIYYFAVVDRQSQDRVRLGVQALKRIQHEVDARLLRYETVMIAPGVGVIGDRPGSAAKGAVPGADAEAAAEAASAAKKRGKASVSTVRSSVLAPKDQSEEGAGATGRALGEQQWLAELGITPLKVERHCDAIKRGNAPVFTLSLGSSLNQVEGLFCPQGGEKTDSPSRDKRLTMPAEQLLQAPAALRRFERVALVEPSGAVLASVTAPAMADPQGLSHQPISTSVQPTNLEPYLRKALRERELTLASGPDRKPDAVPDDSQIGEPQVVEIEIAREKYRLYLLPFAPERTLRREAVNDAKPAAFEQLYLVGLQRRSTLIDATQALGVTGLWYLIASVLLLLAALPLLRVLLIGDTEAAPRTTLAATVISLVLIPSLLVIVLLCEAASSHALGRWDLRAAAYAEAIDAALAQRLRQMRDAIDKLGPRFDAGTAGDRVPDGAEALQAFQCAKQAIARDADGEPVPCDFSRRNPSYCHLALAGTGDDGTPELQAVEDIDSLFLTDAAGTIADHPYLSARGCQARSETIPLGNREYFRALNQFYGWTLPPAEAGAGPSLTITERAARYIAQRVYSRASGDRSLVLAVPRVDEYGGAANGIFGTGAPVFELSAAVPPPFLGFAVIDNRSGTVVFHVDDDSSLQENFFHDIGNDPAILAAIAAGRAYLGSAEYLGVERRFTIRPFVPSNDPDAQAAWSIVTWYGTAEVLEPVVLAALIAVIGLSLYMLVLATVGGLFWLGALMLAQTRARRLQPWQWLWPQWRLRRHYPHVASVVAGVMLIEFACWARLTPGTALLVTLLLLPLMAMLLSMQLAPRPAAQGQVPSRRRRWTDRDDAVTPTEVARFRAGYLICILLALTVTGVIPAAGLFLNSLPSTQHGALMRAFEQTGRRFESRVTRLDSHLRAVIPNATERLAVYYLPYWSALSDRTPTPGLTLHARADETDDGSAGASRPPIAASALIDRLWPIAGRLVPSQIEAYEAFNRSRPLCHATPIRAADGTDPLAVPLERLEYIHRWPLGDPVVIGYALHALDVGVGELLFDFRGDPLIGLRNLALLALLLLAIWQLVRLVMRRVLGIDAPLSPPRPTLGAGYDALRPRVSWCAGGDGEWWYVLAAPDGTTPDAAAVAAQLDAANLLHAVVDLAADTFAALPVTGPASCPVVLTHFDMATLDPARRKRLLDWLETLLRHGPTVLILSARTPCWLRLTRPELFPDAAVLPAGAELAAWQALEARFVVHQFDEPEHQDWLPGAGEHRPGHAPAPERLLDRSLREEGLALRELLGRDMDGLVQLFRRGVAVRSTKDFETLAIRVLDAQLRHEWIHCSIAERVVLYAIARGQLPNPLNRAVLDDLLQRRLLVLAPEPQIASRTFRRYVLGAESPGRYAEWLASGERGTWSKIRGPVLVVLALLGAVLFYSFGKEFTALSAALAALPTLLSNIGKVASLARTGDEPAK